MKTIFDVFEQSNKEYVNNLIKLCLETEEINKRIELVDTINNILPYGFKIKIPTIVTNNYIDQELYSLEEILPPVFYDLT